MRDSLLIEFEGMDGNDDGETCYEKRVVPSLLHIASEKVLERFIPPR